jgi:PhnB protein
MRIYLASQNAHYSEEETTRLFNGLSEGGTVMMPVEHQLWGALFGMLTDKFGIQ